MANVDIKKLSKSYDHKTQVLRDIDVSIQSGEFIVLVGPSGCGKSTLLRTIAGLEDITSGEISIAGRVVNHLPPADRNIAMVFQDYALYPHMTVRQNLAFGLKVRKTPRAEIEKQIGVAADILGLQPLLDRKPSALSGGQRQRVAIGRAIVRKPDVFLFDEPLSNLDAQLRMRTRVEIAALHRRLGATTIYVTHDQTEAMTLADKIVLLNRGVVQQMGAPMDLYLRPCNKFVASFLGSPGMNFIDGHFDGPTGFASEGFRLPDATAVTSGPVALGIRPEDVCLATNGQHADVQLPALVVEPLGYETLIAFETPSGDPLLLRTLSAEMPKVRAGDTLPIRFKREAIQWFASTGDGERLG